MHTSLVSSAWNNQTTVLSNDQIRRAAPSVFAEHARPGVSSRYSFVSTSQVIDTLRSEGWEPVRAREQRVRAENRIGFQMHELRFARANDLAAGSSFRVGNTRAEMVLQNAHDGSRAYRIDAGLFRLVCSNGLTVADTTFAHVSIRHVDVAPEAFAQAAQSVASNAPQVLDTVARWQGVQLAEPARVEFARRASLLRWDPENPVLKAIEPEKLLRPLRYADDAKDLWTTFNVVQEHLIRGGDRYLTREPSFGFRRNRTREVAGLNEGQKINKELWALAGQFANN